MPAPFGDRFRQQWRASMLFAAICLFGCTTAYRTELMMPSKQASLSATPMVHCLQSLGFEDHSTEPVTRAMMREDPTLIARWAPARSRMYNPYAATRAFVYQLDDRWSVNFLPGQGGGDDSSYFANAFTRCLTLHDPEARVEVRSTTALDLR